MVAVAVLEWGDIAEGEVLKTQSYVGGGVGGGRMSVSVDKCCLLIFGKVVFVIHCGFVGL